MLAGANEGNGDLTVLNTDVTDASAGCCSCRNGTFELKARYTDDSPVPAGLTREIGTFTIGPPQPPSDGSDKAKLKARLEPH